jgi:hypothetical protein
LLMCSRRISGMLGSVPAAGTGSCRFHHAMAPSVAWSFHVLNQDVTNGAEAGRAPGLGPGQARALGSQPISGSARTGEC